MWVAISVLSRSDFACFILSCISIVFTLVSCCVCLRCCHYISLFCMYSSLLYVYFPSHDSVHLSWFLHKIQGILFLSIYCLMYCLFSMVCCCFSLLPSRVCTTKQVIYILLNKIINILFHLFSHPGHVRVSRANVSFSNTCSFLFIFSSLHFR